MLQSYKNIVMLGIGGIGMSALARYFHQTLGCAVYGYDKTPSSLTSELEFEGMKICFADDILKLLQGNKLTEEETLVIYTPAIPKDLSILHFFQNSAFTLVKRAKALGLITQTGINLSVAGTHGKTTTSTLLSHLLITGEMHHVAFLGGISTNTGSNYHNDLRPIDRHISVTEADEYDRSFLQLEPDYALITSVDADHLDIYGEADVLKKAFNDFALKVDAGGFVVVNATISEYITTHKSNKFSYGIEIGDYHAKNIRIQDHLYHFDFITPTANYPDLVLGIPGLHNVENAVGACALYLLAGGNPHRLADGLQSFKGVKRRFEYVLKQPIVYIDDYAHHPSELNAIISSVKNMYPEEEIMAIFQPHLFSRTRDFADEFAQSLSKVDKLILMDIYPAREEPIEGVTSQMLIDKMEHRQARVLGGSEILQEIKSTKPRVLLTLGAGDIDRMVQPIKELFL